MNIKRTIVIVIIALVAASGCRVNVPGRWHQKEKVIVCTNSWPNPNCREVKR